MRSHIIVGTLLATLALAGCASGGAAASPAPSSAPPTGSTAPTSTAPTSAAPTPTPSTGPARPTGPTAPPTTAAPGVATLGPDGWTSLALGTSAAEAQGSGIFLSSPPADRCRTWSAVGAAAIDSVVISRARGWSPSWRRRTRCC